MNDTGRFFGEVEKPIMESMLYANIFKKLTIYDLQGLCENVIEIRKSDEASASPGLLTVSILCCKRFLVSVDLTCLAKTFCSTIDQFSMLLSGHTAILCKSTLQY